MGIWKCLGFLELLWVFFWASGGVLHFLKVFLDFRNLCFLNVWLCFRLFGKFGFFENVLGFLEAFSVFWKCFFVFWKCFGFLKVMLFWKCFGWFWTCFGFSGSVLGFLIAFSVFSNC